MRSSKLVLLLATLGAAACALSQTVTLDAFQDQKPAGRVTYKRTFTGQGCTSITDLKSKTPKGEATALLTTYFDKKGAALKRLGEFRAPWVTMTFKATFKGSTAIVTSTALGKTFTRTYASASKASAVDPTVWWFAQGAKPKAGLTVKYQVFNILREGWQDITATYVGPQKVKVGRKMMTCHLITEVRADGTEKLYVDDQGMPLMSTGPKIQFVRHGF